MSERIRGGCVKTGIPRGVEMILALGGLIVSSPLLLVGAVLVRFSSPGPVLFRQQRVGRFGKPFELLKFRTMRVESEGPQVTARGDARVTRVGRFLRRSKLDELPELWNVVRGDLSLVGPRPEVPQYVNMEDPMWQKALETRPGITDPITLRLRNEEELLGGCQGDPEQFYLQVLQPYKLRRYVEYLQQRSFQSDLRVLLQTIVAVVIPSKASPPRLDELVNK